MRVHNYPEQHAPNRLQKFPEGPVMVEHDEAASGEAVLRGMRRKAGVNLSFEILS
jgi:hypothetical protein